MKLKSGFVIKEVGTQTVAVATGKLAEEFRGMLVLNSTAKYMVEKLMDGIGEEELCDCVCRDFGINREKAASDVKKITGKLRDAGLTDE